MSRVAVLTGVGSGMGRATAELLSARGWTVEGCDLVTGPAAAGVRVSAVDVRDEDAVRAWVAGVEARHGLIDAVVTFAGAALVGGVEETSSAEAAALFDLNVLGSTRVVRAALPGMRSRRSGRIILVGSGAGAVAQPYAAWYAASKAAVERIAEGLRLEVAEHGVQAAALIPGWTRTGIVGSATSTSAPLGAYDARRESVTARSGRYMAEGQAPEAIAAAVLRMLSARRMPAIRRVGRDVTTSWWARRLLPARTVEKSVRDYYGLDEACRPDNREATVTATQNSVFDQLEMLDPDGGGALSPRADGTLVTGDGHVAVDVLDARHRIYRDTALDGTQQRELANEKVRFAYKIYSKAYPIVATLVFWIIWNGRLGILSRFYCDQIRRARDHGSPWVEVGPGDGSLTTFAMKTAKLDSLPPTLFVDLSPDMLRRAARLLSGRQPVTCLVQDVHRLGIAPGTLNSLGCYGALHVFPDPAAALTRLAALLSDDGELSLSVLTTPTEAWKNRMVERFVRTGTITSNLTVEQLRELVSGAGLEILEEQRNGHQVLLRTVRRA